MVFLTLQTLLKDGLYGAGKWTYSTNVTASSGGSEQTVASASWGQVGYDSDLSASVAAGNVWFVSGSPAQLGMVNLDLEGVRGVNITADGGGAVTANYNQFNYVDGAGNVYLFYGSTLQTQNGTFEGDATYPMETKDNMRGDFEDGASALGAGGTTFNTPIEIPEVNVKMKSEAIVAKTKKLKAVWTPEFAQDLNAYHSLDAEAELTSIMSEYIALEIDLEILGMLIENALTTEYWSAKNNVTFDANGETDNGTFYNTQGQWFQTLGTKINKVSNKIHQLTLRGGANFMVCSPTIGTVLESIPGFAASDGADADSMSYAFGIQKVGNLNTKYQVYKNPYMTENTILLGFKGSQFLETGATFAPYIPLIMTPLVYDPETFTPRKGLLTRYAKKMLRPEYYAKIYVNGLNTL
jgi:hypothetical protein